VRRGSGDQPDGEFACWSESLGLEALQNISKLQPLNHLLHCELTVPSPLSPQPWTRSPILQASYSSKDLISTDCVVIVIAIAISDGAMQ